MSEADDIWSTMDRLPIALIVDDPMPCINPLYYFYTHVRGIPDPPFADTIPVSLLERFAELTQAHGVRGVFTVVPYPAGLGSIADGLEGFDDADLEQWIGIVKEQVKPAFDIHPEILTHTLALDLDTRTLRKISEHEWSDTQDEPMLTSYFAEAMSILKNVGLDNHGVTQPCGFTGDQDRYARSVLSAEQAVNDRSRTHYFLDILPHEARPVPYCRLADDEADAFVVSIPSGTGDAFWAANEDQTDAGQMADSWLAEDGRSGRLVELLEARCPLVMVTHWQSLYGNGTLAGIRGLELVLDRVRQHLTGRVEWMKISQVSELTIRSNK